LYQGEGKKMLRFDGWNRVIVGDIRRDFEDKELWEQPTFDIKVVQKEQSLLGKAFHALSKNNNSPSDEDINYALRCSEKASKLAKKAKALAQKPCERKLAEKASDLAEILDAISNTACLSGRTNIEYRLGSSKASQVDDNLPILLAQRSSSKGWSKKIADAKTALLKIRYSVHCSWYSVTNNAARASLAAKLVHEKAPGSKYSDLCSIFAASAAIDAEDINSEKVRIEAVIHQITDLPRKKHFGEI